jgi:hypothetical protein
VAGNGGVAGSGGDDGVQGTDLEAIAEDVATLCAIGPEKCFVFNVQLCEQLGTPSPDAPCLAEYAERVACLAGLAADDFYCVEDSNFAPLPDGPCQGVMDAHETCLTG